MLEWKDFLGNPIRVGDEVVYTTINGAYLIRGTVLELVAKTRDEYNWLIKDYETRQYPEVKVRVDRESYDGEKDSYTKTLGQLDRFLVITKIIEDNND